MNKKSRSRKGTSNEKAQWKKLERKLGLVLPFERLEVGRNLKWRPLKTPKGPREGAQFTTRQIASTFGVESGISNVGGGTTGAGQIVQGGATAAPFALAFQLSDLSQSSTFASMFDQYRMEKVKVHFKARSNAVAVFNTASPNGAVPTAYIVVDRDDASPLASIQNAMEYDNVQAFNGEEDCTVELVPSVTPAVFASGAFSAYTTVPSDGVWLDIANTSVPCYGVKGVIGGLTVSTTSSWVWDVIAEYVISFRKTR